MTQTDVVYLGQRLHNLYPGRFPGLTQALAEVWLHRLETVDPEVMEQTLLRWATQHQVEHAPTLQNLCDTIDLVEADLREIQAAVHRAQTPSRDIDKTLEEALAKSPEGLRSWGNWHIQLMREGLGKPSNYPATAERCRQYASVDCENTQAWLVEASWWDRGAPGHHALRVSLERNAVAE